MIIYSPDPSGSKYDFRAVKQMSVDTYLLSKDIEEKLIQLAGKMGIESGSADLLLTKDGQVVFLEFNPVGQIDFISTLSNTYIEKAMAKQLIYCEAWSDTRWTDTLSYHLTDFDLWKKHKNHKDEEKKKEETD